MAHVETAIVAILEANTAVAAIVGRGKAARVYPGVIPVGGELPAITFQRIAAERAEGLDGTGSLAWPRVQLTCWAGTYLAARDLFAAVRDALLDYSGTSDTVAVADIRLLDDGDMVDPAPGAESRARYGVRLDLECWHTEP